MLKSKRPYTVIKFFDTIIFKCLIKCLPEYTMYNMIIWVLHWTISEKFGKFSGEVIIFYANLILLFSNMHQFVNKRTELMEVNGMHKKFFYLLKKEYNQAKLQKNLTLGWVYNHPTSSILFFKRKMNHLLKEKWLTAFCIFFNKGFRTQVI